MKNPSGEEAEGMRVHELKIERCYLENILNGRKKAEIRLNDRDYQVGDMLQFNNAEGFVRFVISHVCSFSPALKDGYVVLSLTGEPQP